MVQQRLGLLPKGEPVFRGLPAQVDHAGADLPFKPRVSEIGIMAQPNTVGVHVEYFMRGAVKRLGRNIEMEHANGALHIPFRADIMRHQAEIARAVAVLPTRRRALAQLVPVFKIQAKRVVVGRFIGGAGPFIPVPDHHGQTRAKFHFGHGGHRSAVQIIADGEAGQRGHLVTISAWNTAQGK
ncbi:hypothetical protein S101468_03240 (plasmid) [Acetobacter pasteurianus subsp. pasteurianus]|uniref:Uncharacterized protein n=1 Tax=Acetobacter pasteurianus subsp. pasteurianus TaxID=481145 RepID=A0AAC9SW68_ACEPA|nr:hypothetical protein S101468_03240 [Acetobacter pasteurianus subsp. pasteurianus]